MELNDIIKLVNAGYTKEDIEAMGTSEQAEQVEQVEDVKQAEDVKQVEQAEQVEKEVNNDAYSVLINEIKAMREDMHKQNIMRDALQPKENTATDILASIINPFTNEEVK